MGWANITTSYYQIRFALFNTGLGLDSRRKKKIFLKAYGLICVGFTCDVREKYHES